DLTMLGARFVSKRTWPSDIAIPLTPALEGWGEGEGRVRQPPEVHGQGRGEGKHDVPAPQSGENANARRRALTFSPPRRTGGVAGESASFFATSRASQSVRKRPRLQWVADPLPEPSGQPLE